MDPFRNKDKKELAREAEESKRIADKIARVIEDAQSCLNSTTFAKYRESVKEAREGLIKLMKLSTEPDPVKFAFFAKTCLSKIDVFDMMLDEVEKDSKKGEHGN